MTSASIHRLTAPDSDSRRSRSRRRGPKSGALTALSMRRVRYATALSMPAATAAFGWVAGAMLHSGNVPMAIWAYALVGLVLTVSLPHVASGLRVVTRLSWLQCTTFAIVVDGCAISAESFVHFGGLGVVELTICWVLTTFFLVLSAYFNFVGFEEHN